MRFRAVVLASALAFSLSASAELITNGGFETADFTGWNVNAGATFVTSNQSGYLPNSGSYFAALGNVFGLGTLSQTFADTPGATYTLSYYLASNGTSPNEFRVDVGSTTLFDQVDIAATGGYIFYSFQFTGTGSDTLTIYERDDPSYLALDDVSVTAATSNAVPEPQSILLLGTGLLGLAGAARRRFAHAIPR